MTPEQVCKEQKGLVRLLVRRQIRKNRSLSSHYDDLVQDGVEGLLYAVTKYKPEQGKFVTLAWICIQQHVQAGALRYIGITSRGTHYKTGRIELWKTDQEATTFEGEVLGPDATPARSETPEQIAIKRDLAKQLSRRLRGRDGEIFAQRLTADDTYAGGLIRSSRKIADNGNEDIAQQRNLSRERVRQILQQVGARVRAWGDSIEQEAA